MPTYDFTCPSCGHFTLVRPMQQASASTPCPQCGTTARRIYGSPALRNIAPGLRRALDAAEASADQPTIVNTVPGRSRSAFNTSRDPRHARLPRP